MSLVGWMELNVWYKLIFFVVFDLQIKIAVVDVTNISKTRTAGIIPNAVGIETKTEKVSVRQYHNEE